MTVIDRNTWPREGRYRFFAPMSRPFCSPTFPVDVTAPRSCTNARGLSAL